MLLAPASIRMDWGRMIGPSGFFLLRMLAMAGLLTAIWAGDHFGCLGYLHGLPLGVVAMFGTIYAFALT